MDTEVQIDPAGRVVLPKRIRERFKLRGGDTLTLKVKGEAIELRPRKPAAELRRVNGVLVLVSDRSLPVDGDLVAESREERIEGIIRGATEEG